MSSTTKENDNNKKLPVPMFSREKWAERLDGFFGESDFRLLLGIIFLSVLIGSIITAIVYLAFPTAAFSIAALLGLSGATALVIPLFVLGLASVFLVLSGLIFSLWAILIDEDDKEQSKPLRYLALLFAFIAGMALGVFLAAASPAIFSLLPAFGLTGGASIAVALTLAALLTGLVFLIISALAARLVYRSIKAVPLMKKNGSLHLEPLEVTEKSPEELIQQARALCLPEEKALAPQYAQALKIFKGMPTPAHKQKFYSGTFSELAEFESQVVQECQNKEPAEIFTLALAQLKVAINHYHIWLNHQSVAAKPVKELIIKSLSFVLQLAQQNDPILHAVLLGERQKPEQTQRYQDLFDYIHQTKAAGFDKEAALAKIDELAHLNATTQSLVDQMSAALSQPKNVSREGQNSESKASFDNPITGDGGAYQASSQPPTGDQHPSQSKSPDSSL